MIRATDSASTLELAQYAEEQLRPLVDQLPGGSLQMDLNLGFPFFEPHGMHWSLNLSVRENGSAKHQGDWIVHAGLFCNSGRVDRAVVEVREHLAKLKEAA